MGALALSILWLNAGLVIAVALKQLGRLRRLGARARLAAERGELVEGLVRRADGEAFAVRRVHQLGRSLRAGREAILFTDGRQSFEVLGGEIETAQGTLTVPAADAARSEVWHEPARGQAAVEADPVAYDEALAAAGTYKGYAHDIEVPIREGERVFVWGARRDDELVPDEDAPLLVSTIDPRAFVASRVRLLALFVLGALVTLIGVTALAVWPPRFELVSTIGGALGLAYFLAIQPLGTAVRDAVKTPARRLINGEWRRPPSPLL
ncbi:MAG: hypothetical protein AB7P00_28870 [Sandaracinaceae bacterium]